MKDVKTKEPDDRWLTIKGATEHNLKNVDARFPVFTCVTGVSGSGKSSLVNDILAVAAARKLNGAKALPGKHRGLTGLEHFEKAVQVDQEPIGRSPRSNPASYVGLLDLLRDLFAKIPLAKVRGYKANRFSFNVRGGRCERCQGDGQIRLDMQFMADAYTPCPSCDGRRFNRETLEVRYHGKNIADVLDLTVREGAGAFPGQSAHRRKTRNPGRRRPRLPAARPVGDDAVGRRGPAHQAVARTQQTGAGDHALHSR